jgi:hypothetical protein
MQQRRISREKFKPKENDNMQSALIDAEPGILTAPTGELFCFKNGISAVIDDSVQPSETDIVDNAADTWDDVVVKITGELCGEWEALSALFPYRTYRRSQNMFGADAAWTIHTTSGRLFTFPRAAVTGYPSINLAPDKSIFGSGFEVTALRKDNTPWSTAGSLYTETASAFASWSFFNSAGILKVNATAVLGALAAPWSGIETAAGWAITPQLLYKPFKSSETGTIQAFFQGERWMAKCQPINVLPGDIITAQPIQGGTARRGAPLASGNNLVLTGAGGSPVVNLTSVQIRKPGYRFGNETIRIGELGFEAQRTYTSGQPQPLVTLT